MSSKILIKLNFLVCIFLTTILPPLFSQALEPTKQIQEYIKQGDYKSAGALCEQLLKKMPDDTDLMVQYGYIELWNNNYQKSEQIFLDVLQLAPDYGDAALGLLKIHLWSKDFNKLEDFLTQHGNNFKNSSYTRRDFLNAELLLKLNKSGNKITEDALNLAKIIIKEDPNNKHAKRVLRESVSDKTRQLVKQAENEIESNHLHKAAELYSQASELEPDNIQLRITLARVVSWNNKYFKALNIIDSVLSKIPNDTEALNVKARIYAWSRKWKDAENTYLEILKIDDDNASARKGLVDIYRWQRKYNKAMPYLKALMIELKNPEDLVILHAQILADSGKRNEAIKNLESHLSSHPDSPLIRAALINEYTRAQRLKEAINELRKSIKLDDNKNKLKSYLTLGQLYSYQNKTEEAIKLYDDLLKKDPNNVTALSGLGNTYSFMRLYRKALNMYQRALNIDPEYSPAVEGIKEIQFETSPELKAKHKQYFYDTNPSPPDNSSKFKYFDNQLFFEYFITPDDGLRAKYGFGYSNEKEENNSDYAFNVDQTNTELRWSRQWNNFLNSITSLSLWQFSNRDTAYSTLNEPKTIPDFYGIVQLQGKSYIIKDKTALTNIGFSQEYYVSYSSPTASIQTISDIEVSRQIIFSKESSFQLRINHQTYTIDREASQTFEGQYIYKFPQIQGLAIDTRYGHVTSPSGQIYTGRIFWNASYPEWKLYMYCHYKYYYDTYLDDSMNEFSVLLNKPITKKIIFTAETQNASYKQGDRLWHANISLSSRF